MIGDAATDSVVAGFEAASAAVGDTALRQCRHRLEHLEMVDPDQARRLAAWGVVASVQPAFDAAWAAEMYALRLGVSPAAAMNPFARLEAAGMVLAFGSDAPVTPVDPWGTVRAAIGHRSTGSEIGAMEALAAHAYEPVPGRRRYRPVGRHSGPRCPGVLRDLGRLRLGPIPRG